MANKDKLKRAEYLEALFDKPIKEITYDEVVEKLYQTRRDYEEFFIRNTVATDTLIEWEKQLDPLFQKKMLAILQGANVTTDEDK